MAEENQEGVEQETSQQTEPENKNESLSDILKETIPEQQKETDADAETSKKEEVKEEVKSEDKQGSETDTVKSDSLLPHNNFTTEEKEYFNSLDESGKKVMLNKWRNLESGYDKKFKGLAKERKFFNEFNEIYEPHKQRLGLSLIGITPMQYTQNLYVADEFLDKHPYEGIKELARIKGVDLSKLNQTPEEQDPTKKELNSLKNELGSLKQELSNRDLSTVARQIENFKNAKDTNGNLKYPHFDTVKSEMAKLNTATGEDNLEVLYNKAIRLHDDLYQKQLDAEFAKRQADMQKQADLSKAKKVGIPIKSSLNAKVKPSNKLGLRQIIKENIS
jgi:hypothetical protein